ncbi:MAG: peptidylprolyl isomerase [Chloroflexi bacterium]|nr:peptidylprolyl isomerase [Chloroflexota bacterium]
MNRYINYRVPIIIILLAILVPSCSAPSPSTPASTPSFPIIFPTEPPPCTTITAAPTPKPEESAIFPPENSDDRVRGANDPTVTITEYSDYADFRSGLFAEVVGRLLNEHPKDVRVISRTFPILGANEKAALSALAAQAAEAAAEQNKYWEMHDLLYKGQAIWANLSAEELEQWLSAQASGLGMDGAQFQSDLKREDIVAKIQKAWKDGQLMGLPFTPFVLINGQIYTGPRDHASMDHIVRLIALGKRQFTSCPPMTIDKNRQYIATLHTEKGDVTIQLFADKAPITVNSFIFLAQNRWYEDITFHRVIPKVYAQTGDPSGTGKGNPGYYLATEILPSLTFNQPGMVAMVNSGPDTSGSQFFITFKPIPEYDGQFTIFGQVLSGMDVLQSLTTRDPQPGYESPPGDKLLSVTIEEK